MTQNPTTQTDLPLKDAIQASFFHMRQVDAWRHEVAAAEHAVKAVANERWNPNLRVQVLAGSQEGTRSVNINGVTATAPVVTSLLLDMPLWDSGRYSANVALYATAKQQAELNLLQQQADAAALVRNIYWSARLATTQKALFQGNVGLLKKALSDVQKRKQERLATGSDVALGEAALAWLTQRVNSLDQEIRLKDRAWREVTGMPSLAAAQLEWQGLPPPPQIEPRIPDSTLLKLADNQVQAKQEALNVQLATGSTEVNVLGRGSQDSDGRHSSYVGMQLLVPIYDNKVKSSRAAMAREQLQAAQLMRDGLLESMQREARQYESDLVLAKEQAEMQSLAISASAQRLHKNTALFRHDEADFETLLSSFYAYWNALDKKFDAERSFYSTYNASLQRMSLTDASW